MDEQKFRAAEKLVWDLWGVDPTEHFAMLPAGNRVRVLEVGTGPPALFVHGAGTAGTVWADLVAHLPDRRCLVIDRPGCGLSDPVRHPTGPEHLPYFAATLLTEVMDALDVARADVVSTSLGGYHALRTAAMHQERVRHLVHFGWTLGAPLSELPPLLRLATGRLLGQVVQRLHVTDGMVRAVLRQSGLAAALDDGRVTDEAVAWAAALHNHTPTLAHELALVGTTKVREQLDGLVLPDEELFRVAAPVHVVMGSEDPFGTVETMRELVDAMPHATMEVWEGAGHAAWVHDLAKAAKLVDASLSHDDGPTWQPQLRPPGDARGRPDERSG